jgi:hypothetical protein
MAAAPTGAPAIAQVRITACDRRLHARLAGTFFCKDQWEGKSGAKWVPRMVPAAAVIPTPSACIHLGCCRPADLLKRPCLANPLRFSSPSCTAISSLSMTCYCFLSAFRCGATPLSLRLMSLSLTAFYARTHDCMSLGVEVMCCVRCSVRPLIISGNRDSRLDRASDTTQLQHVWRHSRAASPCPSQALPVTACQNRRHVSGRCAGCPHLP